MADVLTNLQFFVNGIKVSMTSIDAQMEGGKVRVETIDKLIFYADVAKVITFNVECPILPDGFQIDAFGTLVDGQPVEVMCYLGAGKTFKRGGQMMTAGFGQSQGAAPTQSVSIECPLDRKPV